MITVQNLTKNYGSRPIFDRMSCSFNTGERVGLVGRNGEGKSTLLRMIIGEESPDEGVISMPKGYRLGYLSQHIHFTKPTVIEEACLGLPKFREDEEWAVKIVLSGLGFKDEDFDRSPHEFSGGYQIRLNLAKVLVSEPDMLILDEPTNFLDIVSIRWLEGFLKDWKGEMILVSHDRNFMDSIVTHILGLHRSSAKKIPGNTSDYYDLIEREEEVHESRRLNNEKSRKKMEEFVAKFKARASHANLVQSRVKTLEKKELIEKLPAIATLSFSFNSASFEAPHPLIVSDLTFSYSDNGPNLIEHLDLTLEKGDRLCVIGKNGKGKTTLLKLLAGRLTPKSGNVRIHPQAKMGYYEQANTAMLHDSSSVEEEIASGKAKDLKAVRDICGAMMFSGDDALKKIKVLSGGEKCRVLIGKLLMQPTNLLILDEPTHHLDMASTEALMEAVNEFEGSVVMVTHNEHLLEGVATKLVVFQNDRLIVFPGTYNEFLDQIGWEDEN